VTTLGFVSWYSAVGLLGVERAGLFSGVLPVSALVFSAALGVAEMAPERLLAVVVVAAGITLGVRRGGAPLEDPSSARLRTASSGA
jgi:drug/metabolite transporter (DMT)-like permease